MSALPGVFELRRNQVAVVASTTPTVAAPSPSQSPTTGVMFGAP
jgi:hypothetical protein